MNYWKAWNEMEQLRKEIDRIFEASLNQPWVNRWPLAFLPGQEARRYPRINMYDDAHNVYVEALAPGIDPQKLEVSLVNNRLTLSGEKTAVNGDVKPECVHRSERSAGRFIRTVELPAEVDAAHVEAEYKKGILLVKLPKSEKAQPKSIEVKVASN
ncbi:MAG: Hsp20/alpha crystallin family protein [bacterium]